MESNVKILLYIMRVLFPHFPSYLFPLCMLARYNHFRKLQKLFIIKTIPGELMEDFLLNQNVSDDIPYTVIVNRQHLKQNTITGKFAKLIDNATQKSKQTVFLVGSDKTDEGTILMSDILRFNLGINVDEVKLQPVSNVPFATEVDLSLINGSNFKINNALVDFVVENYFKTPKFVCKEDVINVAVSKFRHNFPYALLKVREFQTMYFKCNRVLLKGKEIPSALCIVGKTTIKQSVNVQGFVAPICKNWTYKGCELVDVCPEGLECCLEKMETAIKPFMGKQKSQIKPVFLLQGRKGAGKCTVVVSLAKKLGMHLLKVSSNDLTCTTYAQTETKTQNLFFKAKLCTPCILAIDNFENYGKNNEGQHDQRIMGFFKANLETLFESNLFPLILICVTNSKDIPFEISRVFLQTIDIDMPNDEQRLRMLHWILKSVNLQNSGSFDNIIAKTRGFVFEDLKALVFYSQKSSEFSKMLSESDFEHALDSMQASYNQNIGALRIPKVQWEDVGGLTNVKSEVIRTINIPLKHPEFLKHTGLKRSGILLYGPPGTGKTLIAKAVATECHLCFLSVKGPELLNMYVGQSEHNVREVFMRAREAVPCIIFFDELDSLAPNRGGSGDSGGVMDRVVSQLLAEMDGLDQSNNIFIIAATNRPDLIDPALLRPGRFDKLLYVGPCTDRESKIAVLEALTRNFKLGKDVILKEVIKMCPKYVTGADLYGLCAGAWMSAVRRFISRITRVQEDENNLTLVYSDVFVTFDDFKVSIVDLQPSVKIKDLQYFKKLHEQLEM